MPTSAPLKTATVICRMTAAERAALERRAADRNLTLSEALRSGLRASLDEIAPLEGRPRVR